MKQSLTNKNLSGIQIYAINYDKLNYDDHKIDFGEDYSIVNLVEQKEEEKSRERGSCLRLMWRHC